MPEIIKAEYKIVTPMFIGDANLEATGISPSSVKGVLRYWWRAINWGRIQQGRDNNKAALEELNKQEGKLFGSSAENGSGQSKFLLRIKPGADLTKGAIPPDRPSSGTQYLLGMGLYNFKTKYLREAIEKGSFTVECILRPTKDIDSTREQLAEALLALGILGGLGSRSRKGFGSIAIQSLTVNKDASKSKEELLGEVPKSIEELKTQLEKWKQVCGQPPFTAFSSLTRIDISLTGQNAMPLLNSAGMEQQAYRSYGRKGTQDQFHKINGKKAEQNFNDDHDLMLNVALGKPTGRKIPERSIFGLPHNYYFSGAGKNIEFSVNEEQKKQNRRASPLFIHVHQFPDGKTALLQSLFPAVFLPEDAGMRFKVQRGKTSSIKFSDSMIDWQTIHNYLDRFNNREQVI